LFFWGTSQILVVILVVGESNWPTMKNQKKTWEVAYLMNKRGKVNLKGN
jgi:hypothetical protein